MLRVAGDVVATAAGAATMGHPAAVGRLAGEPAGRRDRRCGPGMLVFSGGLTEPVPLKLGQSVTAELDGLGTIEVYAR